MLFKNELMEKGELFLVDVSLETGVAVPALGFGATAGDVNRDGWPDLYVTSYNRYGRVMPNSWHQATNGTPNLLFINQKDGTFRESAKSWGVDDGRWSYAAQFVDLNHDGRQDLYVVNDFGENALYMNLGNRFEDRAKLAGVLDPGQPSRFTSPAVALKPKAGTATPDSNETSIKDNSSFSMSSFLKSI